MVIGKASLLISLVLVEPGAGVATLNLVVLLFLRQMITHHRQMMNVQMNPMIANSATKISSDTV